MKYRVVHSTEYTYTDPVPVCHNLVHLSPRQLPHQSCGRFEICISPGHQPLVNHRDVFGNEVHYFSIQEPHRSLAITASSEIEVRPRCQPATTTTGWEQQLSAHLSDLSDVQYTRPSWFVPLRQELGDFARISFRAGRPTAAAAACLTQRIHRQFEYNPSATTVTTPVEEVFRQRAGVCQDFAHLQIACLRSIGIPARYVSGYLRTTPPAGKPRLVGADASHAWLSVYCGAAGWIDFDPTNNVSPGTDYITVGWGRDYQDVCPVRGVVTGGGRHRLSISVDVEPIETIESSANTPAETMTTCQNTLIEPV